MDVVMASIRSAAAFIDDFEWEQGVTPLSNPYVMVASVVVYLVIVFTIKSVVNRPVVLPAWIPALHNFNLCIGSLVMFLGCAWECIKVIVEQQGGMFWMVCTPPGTPVKGGLYFWSYMYYLSKYYEFIDTFLLALKGKPLTFLHVGHHTLVCPMAYLWLSEAQSLQHIGLLFNTGIHVVMYYYYMLCSLKIYPAWKKFITTGQIVQFTFSFVVSVPFWYVCLTSGRAPADTCAGWHAMLFNAAFNAMLLLLFLNFHRQTYKARQAKAAKAE